MSSQLYSTSSTPTIQIEPSSPREEWAHVKNPSERRKIQNRIAQRKFREKARQQRQLGERAEENERFAGATYTPPHPGELDVDFVSGPPWGSISLKHIIQTGRERQAYSSRQFGSGPFPATAVSSSLGLHLADQYARGVPAWTSWRIPTAAVQYTAGSIDTDSSIISDR